MKISRYSKNDTLIAYFMGWIYDDAYDHFYTPKMMKEKLWREATLQLNFSTSWDWLMPVVEKIESLGVSTQIHYQAGSKNYATWILGLMVDYDSTNIFPSKIDAVYSAVVKFIKWYNKNK